MLKPVLEAVDIVAFSITANEQPQSIQDCYFQLLKSLDVFYASEGSFISEFILPLNNTGSNGFIQSKRQIDENKKLRYSFYVSLL